MTKRKKTHRKRSTRRAAYPKTRAQAPKAPPKHRTPAKAKLIAAVKFRGTLSRKEALTIVSSSTIQRAVKDGALVKTRAGREVSYSAPVEAPCRPADIVVGSTHDGLPCKGVPGGRVHAIATLLAGRKQTIGQRIRENITLLGF